MIDCITPDAAAALLRDGDMVLAGGNGGSGVPEAVFEAIERRFTAGNGPHDLTLFHVTGVGALTEKGMCHFAHPGLVRRVIGGNFGMQLPFMKMILAQDVEAYNFPQGVMTHLCRAMAGRQPGVLTHVGLETYMDPRQDGGLGERPKGAVWQGKRVLTTNRVTQPTTSRVKARAGRLRPSTPGWPGKTIPSRG